MTALASMVLLGPFGPQQATASTETAATSSLANVQLYRSSFAGYFGPDSKVDAFLHTWSLSAEEQFYLVLPAGLLLVWWLARRTSRSNLARLGAIALVAVGAVGSFGLSWVTSGDHLIGHTS